MSIGIFFVFFSKRLRLSNPWNYKIPFLITIPYLVFLIGSTASFQPIFSILVSIAIIIGVAGIGYLTNDLGDRKKDALILKPNSTQNLGLPSIVFLLVFFLLLIIAPWFYLPFDRLSLILLSVQIILFVVYAFPPLRLKERGFLGVLTDALYAHVVPAVLSSYTFYKFGFCSEKHFLVFVIILCAWQLILGIRNILFHQLKDYSDDIKSQTRTFVTYFGEEKSKLLCRNLLLPFEIFYFFIFALYISYLAWPFLPLLVVFWLFRYMKNKQKIKQLTFRDFAYVFLDDLYIKWIPMVVLILLSLKSLYFLPILVLHFVLFRNEIKSLLISKLQLK